jgi:hypothetical protein
MATSAIVRSGSEQAVDTTVADEDGRVDPLLPLAHRAS